MRDTSKMSNNSDRLVSVAAIAAYLDLSMTTIYRMLKRGTIPAQKIGKVWRFSTNEIAAWVANGGRNI